MPVGGSLRPPGELPFRDEQPGHVRLFEGEEPDLFRNAAGVSRQAAVAAHDPMAGDDNADRIVPYGTAYGLRRHGLLSLLPCDFFRNILVGNCFPIRYLQQYFPYGLPEGRPFGV